MRRLPVYFLLDTSGPMCGEHIQALNNALSGMINTLRSDPQALDSLWISIITFNTEVKEIVPLTELVNVQLPEIDSKSFGIRNTGKALKFLIHSLESQFTKSQSQIYLYHKPLIFLISVREPSDKEFFIEVASKLSSIKYGIKIAYILDYYSDICWTKFFSENIITFKDDCENKSLRLFFDWSSKLILETLKKDGVILNVINTDRTLMPKLHNQLMYINS